MLFFFNVQCKPELAPYDYTKTKPAALVIQGTGLSPTSYNIPAIMGNQKVEIPISLTWAQSGTKNCEIIVDYTNTNNESIENNKEGFIRAN